MTPLAKITLAGTALWVGWNIGHGSGLSSWVRAKLLGWGVPTLVAGITGAEWQRQIRPGSSGWSPFNPNTLNGGVAFDGYVLAATGSTGGCPAMRHHFGTSVGTTYTGCTATNDAAMRDALTGTFASSTVGALEFVCEADGGGPNTCDGGGSVRYAEYWFLPPLAGPVISKATVTDVGTYNSAEHAPYVTTTLTSQPREGNLLDASDPATDKALGELASDPGLRDAIDRTLNPTTPGVQGDYFVFPQPRYGETGPQYRNRLRALGFLGTIVLSQLPPDSGWPEFGPNVLVNVQVQSGTLVDDVSMLDPWPNPPPRVNRQDEGVVVELTYNPASQSWPEPGSPGSPTNPPSGPTPPGGGAGGGPGTRPPSMYEAACGKFPFGVFCWIVDELAAVVTVEPRAPHITVTVAEMHSGPFTIPEWSFGWDFAQTTVFDGFIGLIRSVLAFLLWLSGLWFYGKRKMGGNGLPDAPPELDG
jgi:hypothetical protein